MFNDLRQGLKGYFWIFVLAAVAYTGFVLVFFSDFLTAADIDKNLGANLTPTDTYQLTGSADLVAAGDAHFWYFDVTSGSTYRFSFCEGGASAGFDTTLEGYNGLYTYANRYSDTVQFNDDYCSVQSQIDYIPTFTGTLVVRVGSYNNAYTGTYNLAYKKLPTTLTVAEDGTYQTSSGSLSASASTFFEMPVITGKKYRLSLCPVDGGSTAFTPAWTVTGETATTSDGGCGTDTAVEFRATSDQTVSIELNAASGSGAYTVAYKWNVETLATPTELFQADDGGPRVIDNNTVDWYLVDVNYYYYTFSLCSADGGSADFDTTLYLNNQSVGGFDECGTQSKISHYYPGMSGKMTVRVDNYSGVQGTYTLAYRQDPLVLTPTTGYSTYSGDLSVSGEEDYYLLAVEAGKDYIATFCDTGTTGGSATFDATLDVDGTVDSSACANGATVNYSATASDYVLVTVAATNGTDTGSYTLAFAWDVEALPSAPTNNTFVAVPSSPRTISAGGTDSYLFTTTFGKDYTFSLCNGGDNADFNTTLVVNGNYTYDNCGTGGTLSEYTVAGTGGDIIVQVTDAGGSGGTYTLYYREDPPTLSAATGTYQTTPGTLSEASEQDLFFLDVTAGDSYTLTFCDTGTTGGSADFDVQLNVDGTIDNSTCANGATVDYTATATETILVTVEATNGLDTGTYTLAYKKNVPTLTAPTSSYQTTGLKTLAPATTAEYLVDLTEDVEYRFTFCEGGASTTFDTTLTLIRQSDSAQVHYNDDSGCGTASEMFYTVPTGQSGTYRVVVAGYGGAGGNYELAYKQNVTVLTPTSTYLTAAGSIASQGGTSVHYFDVEAGKEYKFSFCEGGYSYDFTPSITITGVTGSESVTACGGGTETVFTSTQTGTATVTITAVSGSGNYAMAYKWNVVELTPTTSFQTVGPITLGAGETDFYVANLEINKRYVFSFCQGGGVADFTTVVNVDSFVNGGTCGNQSEQIFIASATYGYTVSVGESDGVGGSYTLAYREVSDAEATTVNQTVSGQIQAGGAGYHRFPTVIGKSYLFSLCTAEGGSADFDSFLNVGVAENDDGAGESCGTLSEYSTGPVSTDYLDVYISANSGGAGGYTMAYRWEDAVLTPTTTYQTVSGSVTPSTPDYFPVNVEAGKTYTFTFCDGGGSAVFQPAISVDYGTAEAVGSTVCNSTYAEATYASTKTGVIDVQVTTENFSDGSFTLAYKEHVQGNSGSLVAPTTAYQTKSATLLAGATDTWTVNVENGKRYIFSFCNGGASTTFDTQLTVGVFSDDNGCSDGVGGSKMIYTATSTGSINVEVTHVTETAGLYTFAYKELPTLTPFASYQTITGPLEDGEVELFYVDVVAGEEYTFTFCNDGSTGASVAFDSYLWVDTLSNDNGTDPSCTGGASEIIYTATTSDIIVGSISGAAPGEFGPYTLAYKVNGYTANPNNPIYVNSVAGTNSETCGANSTTSACATVDYALTSASYTSGRQTVSVINGGSSYTLSAIDLSNDDLEFGNGSTVLFDGNITANDGSGAVLSFNEGVTATFSSAALPQDRAGINLGTGNSLRVTGTRFEPVIMTRATSGATDFWNGIVFGSPSAESTIEYLHMSYGDNNDVCTPAGGGAAFCITENQTANNINIYNSEFSNSDITAIGIDGNVNTGTLNIGGNATDKTFDGNYFHDQSQSIVGVVDPGESQYAFIANNYFVSTVNTAPLLTLGSGESTGNDGVGDYVVANNIIDGTNGSYRGIWHNADPGVNSAIVYNTFIGNGSDSGVRLNAQNVPPISNNIFSGHYYGINATGDQSDVSAILGNVFNGMLGGVGGGSMGFSLPGASNTVGDPVFTDGPKIEPYWSDTTGGDDYYVSQVGPAFEYANASYPLSNYLTFGTTVVTHSEDTGTFDAGFHYPQSYYYYKNIPTGYTSSTDYDYQDSSEAVISTTGGRPVLGVTANFFTTEDDADLLGTTIETDTSKTAVSVVSGGATLATHTIFIPDTLNAGVYICRSATSVSEVDEDCVGAVTFVQAEITYTGNTGTSKLVGPDTVSVSLVAADGVTQVPWGSETAYYRVEGLTGSGGGNVGDGGAGAGSQTGGTTQQATQDIGSGDVYFTDIPDDFAFPPVALTGNADIDSLNNELGSNVGDRLGVNDLVGNGFTVNLDASAIVSGSNAIPNVNLYAVSTPASGSGTVANGVLHLPGTTGGATAPVDLNEASPESQLANSAQYVNFGGRLDDTATVLNSIGGGAGGYEINMSYYLKIPQFQPPGVYPITFTYTLIPN